MHYNPLKKKKTQVVPEINGKTGSRMAVNEIGCYCLTVHILY